MKISKSLCELVENPLAVNNRSPRFCWVYSANSNNEKSKFQTAYRILVSSSIEKIDVLFEICPIHPNVLRSKAACALNRLVTIHIKVLVCVGKFENTQNEQL